jgi:hypothetical protein
LPFKDGTQAMEILFVFMGIKKLEGDIALVQI